jgi:AcrR family transcriptional regulator
MAAKRAERASGDETRRALIAAAAETLRKDGFAGSTARAIAGRAGCNQSLVFYHFGSVNELLLAALDAVSADRIENYSAAIQEVNSLPDIVDVARSVFTQDLDNDQVKILVEMVAGSLGDRALAGEVATRLEPWKEFAAAIFQELAEAYPLLGLLSPAEAAHTATALYLGLEMLAEVESSRSMALSLFDRADLAATMLSVLPQGYRDPSSAGD